MDFKYFNVGVVLYVLLILCVSLAFSWSLLAEHLYITPFTLAVILIVICVFLIRYIKSTNRKLFQFFDWVKSKETLQHFRVKDSEGNSLNHMLNLIVDTLSEEKLARESQKALFSSIFSHLATGVLVIRKGDGSIILCNDYMYNVLGVRKLNYLSDLDEVQKGLAQVFEHADIERSRIVKLAGSHGSEALSLRSAEFKLQEEYYKIVSLQNIRSELNAEETQTWKKLIRILSHEILNSIAPVKSLSHSMQAILRDDRGVLKSPNVLSDQDVLQIDEGLKVIHKRNVGLLHFVESYRKLAKIPKPVFSTVSVRDVFDNLILLFRERANQEGIHFYQQLDESELSIRGDESQIMQVFINLIENAFNAVQNVKNPDVSLKAFRIGESRVQLQVDDNGSGIDIEDQEKIFLPFYTTKPQGNGIGLSLCRQILFMHNAAISFVSSPYKGSRFIVQF